MLVFLVTAVLALGLASPARADASFVPEQYAVTVQRLDLKGEDGTWVTVIEPDLLIDLAVKEYVLSFFNKGGRVPAGRYVNFRLVLSERIRVSGGADGRYTREGGDVALGGTASRASDLPGAFLSFEESAPTVSDEEPPRPMHIRLNLDNEDDDAIIVLSRVQDLAEPVTVRNGSFIRFVYSVDVGSILFFGRAGSLGTNLPARDSFFCLVPRLLGAANLIVDEDERTFEAKELDLWF